MDETGRWMQKKAETGQTKARICRDVGCESPIPDPSTPTRQVTERGAFDAD
ncbi:MAG: hypothetical protein ABEL76_02325 [Bradymonadaceae bacterium]